MYAPFKIGFNCYIDHMRISDTEPSSVIINQKSSFKRWKGMSQSAKTWSFKKTWLRMRV